MKLLQELADKIPAGLKASTEPKVAALKDKVAEADPDAGLLKAMTKDLQEELVEIGLAAYENMTDANAASAKEQADSGEADHGKEHRKRTKLAKADRKARRA